MEDNIGHIGGHYGNDYGTTPAGIVYHWRISGTAVTSIRDGIRSSYYRLALVIL